MKIKTILSISLCVASLSLFSQNHFTTVWNSPYQPMNIYIMSASFNGIPLGNGDEIAVFDGSNCVGNLTLTAPIGGPAMVIASKDDPTTVAIDGFIEGHDIQFRYWISSQQTEYTDVSAIYLGGTTGIFLSLGTAIVDLSLTSTNLQMQVNISASDSSICNGDSTYLVCNVANGNPPFSYSWSNGASDVEFWYSPSISTVVSVTVVDATSATSTASIQINVSQIPAVNVSALPTSICIGASCDLTAQGADSYAWSHALGSGATKTVTPTVTTTYTVTGTDLNGCTAAASVTVTVNATPAVSASASLTPICEGGSSLLSASGANTYTWSHALGSGATKTVTPTVTTTYTVTGTDLNGCTATASVTVSLNTSPAVSASAIPTAVCEGGSSSLTVSGANTYTWSHALGSGATKTVTPTVTTTYTVTGTDLNGCTATASVTVSVNTLPAVSASALPAAVCEGGSSSLTASGANTYTWSHALGSGATKTVTPTVTTTYTVTGTDLNGCTAMAQVVVIVNPLPAAASAITGPASVTAGQSNVAYSHPIIANATSYLWTYSGTGITINGSGNNVTLNFAANASSGNLTVRGVNACGNGTISQTFPITVNQAAQATLTLQSISAAPGSNIAIPVIATNIPDMTGFQFTIEFDNTKLTYINSSNWSGGTNASAVTIGHFPATGKLTFVYSDAPINIANGLFFNINFTYTGGTACLNWSDNPTFRELSNSIPMEIPCTYFDGCVTESISPPVITTHPISADLCVGESISFSVAANGTAPLTYQWQKNGANVTTGTGGNTSTFTINPVSLTDAGNYACIVTNAANSVTSNPATLTVNPLPAANAGPDQAITIGNCATLTASGGLFYSWNTTPVQNSQSITVCPQSSQTYTVTVVSADGCIATDQVHVTVIPVGADTIDIYIDSVWSCIDDTLLVPVSALNFNDVAAFNFRIIYDTSLFAFDELSAIHPAINPGSGGIMVSNAINNMISIAWFSLNAVTLGDCILFNLKLNNKSIGASNLIWDLSVASDNQISNANADVLPASYHNGRVERAACADLTGHVYYKNASSTPMSNTHVWLKQANDTLNHSMSDINGAYLFSSLSFGAHKLVAASNKPWGGGNSNDALLILKHFTDNPPLTGLYLKAGDVNKSGAVNATDALLVAKRFVQQINSFPSGDWIFSDPVFNINSLNPIQNIEALCAGDVNGSYTPLPKSKLAYASGPEVTCEIQKWIDVPVSLIHTTDVNSLSLALNFDPGVVEVLEVIPMIQGGEFLTQVNAGEIRIAWYAITSLEASIATDLFKIRLRVLQNNIDPNWISIGNESVVGDFNGQEVSSKLSIPELVISNGAYRNPFYRVYPNPANDLLQIEIKVNTPGTTTIWVTNLTGQIVLENQSIYCQEGLNQTSLDLSQLNNGMFFITLEFKDNAKYIVSETQRIVVMK